MLAAIKRALAALDDAYQVRVDLLLMSRLDEPFAVSPEREVATIIHQAVSVASTVASRTALRCVARSCLDSDLISETEYRRLLREIST